MSRENDDGRAEPEHGKSRTGREHQNRVNRLEYYRELERKKAWHRIRYRLATEAWGMVRATLYWWIGNGFPGAKQGIQAFLNLIRLLIP